MKTQKLDAVHVWKQIEDDLAPRLRLSVTDRVVYSHLLRHSRLEGKSRLRFSIPRIARGIALCANSTRWAVRRLISRGVLRLLQCSKAGHVVEVLLPDEILTACGARHREIGDPASPDFHRAIYHEEVDFLKTPALRKAIHARERGRCFYCLRQLTPMARCIDHVVPRAAFGGNSYRNLVSCCLKCNSQKGESSALDFLRRLYRNRRLSDPELANRLRALDALAAGKLRPVFPSDSKSTTQRPPASSPHRTLSRIARRSWGRIQNIKQRRGGACPSRIYRNLVSCCQECNSQKGRNRLLEIFYKVLWLIIVAYPLWARGCVVRVASGKHRLAVLVGDIAYRRGALWLCVCELHLQTKRCLCLQPHE